MATANPTQNKGDDSRKSIARPGETARSGTAVQVAAPSRREFLYYIWGASMALLLGQVTAGLLWFAYPRFREGEFGGSFPFNADDLPAVGDAPESVPSGRFHMSRTENGLIALYGVCTHLGCLPRWEPGTERFECPCHGSKFELDGSYIEGPAPRGLDRFVVTITYSDGESVTSDSSGGPIPLDPQRSVANISVDTGSRVLGPAPGTSA
jgi:cytochrome b6-f complex iron-sulfur subunit